MWIHKKLEMALTIFLRALCYSVQSPARTSESSMRTVEIGIEFLEESGMHVQLVVYLK